MKKISLAQLRAKAIERPSGYYEDVLSRGKVVGQDVELSAEAWSELAEKYRGQGWLEKIKAEIELGKERIEKNKPICAACEYWNAASWLGYGGCTICHCSVLKLGTPGESCPHPAGPKWRN